MSRGSAASPRRTCVGCRRVADPDELVRVAHGPDGVVTVGRHEPGRGAWLCAGSVECFEQAVRRRVLGQALRRALTTDEVAALRARLLGMTA